MALSDGASIVLKGILLRNLFGRALLTSFLNDESSGVLSRTSRTVGNMTPLISWTTPFFAKHALVSVTSTPLTNNCLIDN